MAQRLFNLFAAQLGTRVTGGTPTQIVGAQSLSITEDHDPIRDSSDGVPGVAAISKGAWSGSATLGCQDVSGWAAILAAFEGATTGQRALLFESLEFGLATVTSGLIKRARLERASINLQNDRYADVQFVLRVSADPASDSADDEILLTELQTKTATIAATKRVYRVTSVTHGGVAIDKATGFSIEVRGDVVSAPPGDGEWGKQCEIGGYDVAGRVVFADMDVATSFDRVQARMAAAAGDLVIACRQQDGSTSTTFTIKNVQFMSGVRVYRARGFVEPSVMWEAANVSGTTVFALATGSNKMIASA